MREGRWKLVRFLHDDVTQIFDLEADPWELDDRAADPSIAATRARPDSLLQGWMDGSGDPQRLGNP